MYVCVCVCVGIIEICREIGFRGNFMMAFDDRVWRKILLLEIYLFFFFASRYCCNKFILARKWLKFDIPWYTGIIIGLDWAIKIQYRMLHLMVIYLTWMARQITIFVIIHRSMSKVKWVGNNRNMKIKFNELRISILIFDINYCF